MINSIKNLLRWGIITKAGTDTGQFATQQVSYLGKTANSVMLYPYGIHANASVDSLALMFAVEGNPENKCAIPWTPKIRPELKEGEVAFYHPHTGGSIIWRENGDLEITTEASVVINTPTLTLTGDLVVNGTMTNNDKDVGDTHGHSQGNDSNGDAEAAISGVT